MIFGGRKEILRPFIVMTDSGAGDMVEIMASFHRFKIYHALSELQASQWRELEDENSPFNDYEFLSALEKSGCWGEKRGQRPFILTLQNESSQIVAALITYLKGHSYGEYIFDWSWAQACEQANLPYYPKLISYTPFTPASSAKFLLAKSLSAADRRECVKELLKQVRELSSQLGASSEHFLFTNLNENQELERAGYEIRHSFQYHWHNQCFDQFDDFLKSLKPRKAKQIRKERRGVANLNIRHRSARELSSSDAQVFYQLYLNTVGDKGAIAYLNLEFFELIFTTMLDRVFIIEALDGPEVVAQSLFFTKGDSLFGRYWGPKREVAFLHFELCYYQGIEFAIANKLKRFEAGAQGEHKIPRGFIPTLTYSAHNIHHPGLRMAVGKFIEEEKGAIAQTIQQLQSLSPYQAGHE